MLFEVWDHPPKTGDGDEMLLSRLNDPALAEKFLGLGIVSVEELLITPSQRCVRATSSDLGVLMALSLSLADM